jgi:hypothetical protein
MSEGVVVKKVWFTLKTHNQTKASRVDFWPGKKILNLTDSTWK